ncbi:unnamed protein product [Larinioides sclopetarius]|uniref:Uncharacterized protein n=1 Tax=Larinioides sclopetarius TaxID=280406 RepID=A0AAV2BYM6_9ARAC
MENLRNRVKVLQLSYNASPAASNPQDASPAASIPYDASPAASTSYDNAFVAPVIKVEKVQGGEDSTCQEGSFISETSQVGKEAFIPQQAVREVLQLSYNASPAASNPQDASPAASIPYDASPAASTSYDNAFVAPVIKVEKVQGGEDSTCQEGSFISETSQVGKEAFIPQQAVREVLRPSHNDSPAASTPRDASPAASNPQDASPAASNPQDASPAASNPQDASPAASNPQDASPAASNPQDASPAASIPYDASPSASTSYDNAFVAPAIKIEKVQGGQDSTCQEGSFISETSQVGIEAFIPQQAVREVRRGVKRKRARNILIPTEKAEKIIESQEKTFEALKDIASNLSAANEIARRANEIAEERNNISLRKAIAFENISKILSNVFGNNK